MNLKLNNDNSIKRSTTHDKSRDSVIKVSFIRYIGVCVTIRGYIIKLGMFKSKIRLTILITLNNFYKVYKFYNFYFFPFVSTLVIQSQNLNVFIARTVKSVLN